MTDWDELRRLAEQGDKPTVLAAMKAAWTNTTDILARRRDLMPTLTIACRRFPSVRAHFIATRDALVPEFDGRTGVADWLALNRALDDDQRTLDWFDAARAAGRQPTPWSMLDEVVLRRGNAADYLWLHAESPSETMRQGIKTYLCLLGVARGLWDMLDEPFELVLAAIPLAERQPRSEDERRLAIDSLKQALLMVAAFEAVEPGDHSLREVAGELIGSDFLHSELFTWEQRPIHAL